MFPSHDQGGPYFNTHTNEFAGMVSDLIVWQDLPLDSTIEYLYKNPNANVENINEVSKIQIYYTLGRNEFKIEDPLFPGTFVSNFDTTGFFATSSVNTSQTLEYAKIFNLGDDRGNYLFASGDVYRITGSTNPQRLQLVTGSIPARQVGTTVVDRSNNFNYNSVIPASDYNYSWATSSLGDNYSVRSGNQKIFGYWPKDGLNLPIVTGKRSCN